MQKARLLLVINDDLSAINLEDIKLSKQCEDMVELGVLKNKIDDTLLFLTMSKGYNYTMSVTACSELFFKKCTFVLFFVSNHFWNAQLLNESRHDYEQMIRQEKNTKMFLIEKDMSPQMLNDLVETHILKMPFSYLTKTGDFTLRDYMDIQSKIEETTRDKELLQSKIEHMEVYFKTF